MDRKTHLSYRQLITACLILALFILLTLAAFSGRQDEKRFRQFSHDLYLEEMTENTLSMHYSIANPAAFGINGYTATLPCYTPGSEGTQAAHLSELLSELTAIRPEKLSSENAFSLSLMKNHLEQSLALSRFPYYSEPLSPTQGSQNQLPILLSEYTFRSRRDVEDYLSLLAQTGDYLDSLLLYEQEKALAGTLMPAESLRQTANQCDTIVSCQDLKDGTHFLQTGFRERLDELSVQTPLSSNLYDQYIRQNDQLLLRVLCPAYQRLSEGLEALTAKAPLTQSGLSSLPEGRAYYTALLAAETGSDKTPEEIKELLKNQLQKEYETLRALAADYPGCRPCLEAESYLDLAFADTEHLLEDLKTRIVQDFPSIPGAQALPASRIKTVAPSLRDSSAPAYYLTAPIDNTDTNVIYINPKEDSNQLELYTTLAHEGYPGHLYQNAYCAQKYMSMKDSRLRQLLWFGGYLEGWALYVEQYSYDYAARRLASLNRPGDAVCVQIEKHNRSLQLCLYSLLDILIHYEGADFSQICEFLQSFGVTNSDTVSGIYTYICQSPCNYLKYYLGYLEILELRQQAVNTWQNTFTDPAFHRFLLEVGPADFPSLKDALSNYSPGIL